MGRSRRGGTLGSFVYNEGSLVQLEIGQIIGGELRIVRPLAEGGMGSVYVAEQLRTGKLRAVKTLHVALAHDAAAVERFVREARIGSAIASEHVVEVVSAAVDEATGIPYLAMELLEGDTLEARVQKRGPMPPADVELLYRQIVHALAAAHRVGIVHRDLKPQNIVLVEARRGDTPFTAKILDFGIAKLIEHATAAGNSQVIGSPPWMAPEQLEPGAEISPATDVWSLGLIAFYVVTGRPYWRAANESIGALVAEIVASSLEPASERARMLGATVIPTPAFDRWFSRTIARAARDRFASVEEMLDGLIAALRRSEAIPLHPVADAPVVAALAVPFAPTMAAPSAPVSQPPADSLPRPPAPAPAPSSRFAYPSHVSAPPPNPPEYPVRGAARSSSTVRPLILSSAVALGVFVVLAGVGVSWALYRFASSSPFGAIQAQQAAQEEDPGPACDQALRCCWAIDPRACAGVVRLQQYGIAASCAAYTRNAARAVEGQTGHVPGDCTGPPANFRPAPPAP